MAIQKTETSVNLRINRLNKKMLDDAIIAGEINDTEMYVVDEDEDPSATTLLNDAAYVDDVPSNIGGVGTADLDIILRQDFVLKNLYNPNLLDNSDFTNTVNQRGKDTYTTTGAAYTIDRWILGIGSIAVTANGLVCQGTNISSNWIMQRTVFPFGKVYTLSVKITNLGIFTLTGIASASTPLTSDTPFGGLLIQENMGRLCAWVVFSKTNIQIEWVKLEEGPIATPYLPKGYSAELLECQRYFQWHAKGFHFYLPYVGGNQWYANLPYPTEMRVIPTLTCTTLAGTFVPEGSQPSRFGAKLYGGSNAASSYQCIIQDIILNAEL